MVNTPDCGSGMHGFDPHISPHIEIYALLCAKFKVKVRNTYIMNFFLCKGDEFIMRIASIETLEFPWHIKIRY